MVETTGIPMLMFDREGTTVLANRAVRTLHGDDVLVGRPAWEVLGLVPNNAPAGCAQERTFAELVQRCLLGRPVADHEHVVTAASGARRRISWRFAAVPDGSGGAEHLVATGVDVTRERLLDASRQRLVGAARPLADQVDAVTGAADRAALEAALEDHLDVDRGAGCALLLVRLDPDRATAAADTTTGDERRRALVELLQSAVREDDLVARAEHDDFVVLLAAAGPLEVRAVAARLERVFARPVTLSTGAERLPVCVGFHVADCGQPTGAVLVRARSAIEAVVERRRAARQLLVLSASRLA
jgi:GGDEF domain-containing protein